MAQERYDYEKLDENFKLQYLPLNDYDGKITGKYVFGLKAYFDENPEERKRLGWLKHIRHEAKDILPEYNAQTQYLVHALKQVDEWTIEDVYFAEDKSEEQLLFEEMLEVATGAENLGEATIIFCDEAMPMGQFVHEV